MASHDGQIVLSTKVDTGGIGKGIHTIKGALEKLKVSFKSLGKAQADAFTFDNKATNAKIDAIKKKIAELDDEETKLFEKQQALAESYIPDLGDKDLYANLDPTKAMTKEDLAAYDELGKKIDENQKKARELKKQLEEINETVDETGDVAEKSTKKAGKGFADLGKKIGQIAKRLLVFQTIYKILNSVIDLFKNILASDDEFRQDWEQMKAALITAAQPLINIIVPAVKAIVSIVRDLAVDVGKIAAALAGVTYKQYVEMAKETKKTADNFADMEKSAKSIKRALAGFDDLQILSSGDSNKSSNDYSGFDALISGEEENSASAAQTLLQSILGAVGGLLAGIGLILLTKGQIKWGLAFIIAGAAFWAIKAITESTFSADPTINILAKILTAASTMLVAVGLILITFGQIPWGIAAIATGVVLLATAVALSSDDIVEMIRGPLGLIMAVVGGAMIALGIILICLCPAALPWGIALIVAGAASWITAVVVNKDAILEVIKSVWKKIVAFWNNYIYPGLQTPIKLVANVFSSIYNMIKDVINGIIRILKNIIKFIKNVFTGNWRGAWEAVVEIFKGIWEVIVGVAKGVLNLLIDALNTLWAGLYSAIAGVINGVGSIVNKFGDLIGQDWNFSVPKNPPLIPHLAQGAVIPANHEFLAVLGDQKSGTNIEAPAELIYEMVKKAMNEGGRTGGNTEVILEIDGREFGRAVVEQGNRESRRIGTRLVIV